MVALGRKMDKFDRHDILKIAKLAQLEISQDAIEKKLKEFKTILSFTDKLSAIQDDPNRVSPSSASFEIGSAPLCPDVPRPSLSSERALMNAPDRQDDFFKVPRMIGDSDS